MVIPSVWANGGGWSARMVGSGCVLADSDCHKGARLRSG
jgi:hypothetical protein